MLVYHHTDPPGTAGEGDSLRSVLEAEFASIGDYPVRCRKAAVANGSGYGADQGFAAGDQLILYEYSSFLVDIVGNVWAVPDSTTHIIFDGLMDLIWPLPDDQMQVHVSDTRPYDSAPGGYRASMAQMDTTEVPYGDIIALHQSHCFVPTVSALDLDTDDLFHDIANDPGIMSKTPFDTIYFPVENQEHVDINEGNAGWFLTEIHRGVTGVDGDLVSLPDVPVLYQNYPNPFNPSTTLRIFIPHDGFVTLTVYNVLGEKVKSLINQQMSAGRYTIAWNGCGDDGRPAASGIYFCSLEAGVPVKACKLVLIR
jgi:hypothetical protein